MADKVIRRLLIAFGVQRPDAVLRDIERVQKQTDKVKKEFSEAAREAKYFFGALAAGTGLLVANTVATGKDAEQILRRSRALQQTTRDHQRLLAVFEAYGKDGSDVSDALGTITDRAQDAMDGMQSYIDDFGLVGIKVDELRGKKPEELFDLFADKVANADDRNKALTATVRILGDDLGNTLMPMLQQGSAGMQAMADDAEAMGVVMDETALQSSARLAVSWRQLMQAGKGLRNTIGVAFAPVLQDVVDATQRWVRANGELIRSGVTSFADTVRHKLGQVRDIMERISHAIERTIGWRRALQGLAGAAGFGGLLLVARRVWGVFSALRGLWIAGSAVAAGFGASLGWIAVAVGAVVAAFAGLFLVIEDFYQAIHGNDSATQRFIDGFADQDGVVGSAANALRNLVRWYRGLSAVVREGSDDVAAFFRVLFERLSEWGKRTPAVAKWIRRMNKGLTIAGNTVSGIMRGLTGILDAFRWVYDGFTNAVGNAGGFLEVTGTQVLGQDDEGSVGAGLANRIMDGLLGSIGGTNTTTDNSTTNANTMTVNATGMSARELEDYTQRQMRMASQGTAGVR